MALVLLTKNFSLNFDGAGYLALSTYLTDGRFPEEWNFVREPGLPALIAATIHSPLGVGGYLAVSGLLAGLAVALMGGVFFDLGRTWQRLVAGLFAVTASVYISYAAWLFQQVGLALLLALVAFLLRFIQIGPAFRPWRYLSLAAVGVVGVYYNFVFFGAVVVVVCALAVITWQKSRGRGYRPGLTGAALVLGVLSIPVLAYLPWNAAKEHGPPPATTSGSALPSAFSQSTLEQLRSLGPRSFLKERLQTTAMLLQWEPLSERLSRTSTHPFWASEDLTWARVEGNEEWEHGSECLILVTTEGQAANTETLLADKGYCPPFDGTGFWSATALPSYFFGAATSLGLIIGTVWACFRRRNLLLVLALPWGWLSMYTVFIPLDRYSIPIWPFKTVFSVVLLLMLWEWLWSRWKRRSVSEAEPISPGSRVEPASPNSREVGQW